jgi:hypothetical protein
MRKSRKKAQARQAARAGLTTGVVGAALLIAPGAALAASWQTPPVATVAGVVTITDDTSPFFAGDDAAAVRVQVLLTGTSCSATFVTPTSATVNSDTSYADHASTTTTVKFKLPGTATADTNGKAKRYIVCTYDDDTTARVGSTTGYPVLVGAQVSASPAGGVAGGGNTVTINAPANSPVFTTATANSGVLFTESSCPTSYGIPTAALGLNASATKISDTAVSVTVPSGVAAVTSGAGPRLWTACVYTTNTSAGVLLTAAQYEASVLNLSQSTGSYAGGNSLDVTSTTAFLAGIDTPGVLFSANPCLTDYEVTADPNLLVQVPGGDIRKLGTSRLALTVPPLRGTAPSNPDIANWYMCVYAGRDDGQSDLIAASTYAITTVHTATAVTPKAGPALGGSKIVVSGTALPTIEGAITATLGGTPLESIKPLSATAFEAITPAHAPANNVALVVKTPAGSYQLSNAYSYTSSVQATPNTAPNTSAPDIIVKGVGFQSAAFNSGSLVSGGHFYLVEGQYAGNEGTASSGYRANAPLQDCDNVLVLSDNEAICNLDLTAKLNAVGEAVLDPADPGTGIGATGLAAVSSVAGSRVLRATGDPFTKNHEGLMIFEATAPVFPRGTVITDVVNANLALVSNAATSGGALTHALVSPGRRITINTTNTSTAVTAPAGTFAPADDGAFLVAPGVPLGTLIDTVTDGANIVLGAPADATGTGVTAYVVTGASVPVPEGAYQLTYVSNGSLNASATDPNYVQSLVSSSSTFTVSSF